MTDVQRLYKNNELRTTNVVVGEIGVEEVKGGEVEFTMCTVPKGCVVIGAKLLGDNINVAQSINLNVDTAGTGLSVGVGTEAATGDILYATTKDEKVGIKDVVQFTTGRLIVMVEYIRPDVITGERVRAV